ncbi:MAG: tetratricopeptide repeat protein [Blastocatellia bacterium]
MDAVISGRAGTALIVDGNTLFSFDVDEPDTLVPRAQSDLPYLFGDARDLQFLENSGQEQIKKRLELEYNVVCALDLALILMDDTLSAEVRQEAAAELEELFRDTAVLERLEGILYARPLPDSADITGAKERSEAAKATTTLAVMDNPLSRQPSIRDVCAAWDGIPESEFGGTEQKAEFQRLAIREGLFRALVIAHEGRQVESFLIQALMMPAMQSLRNYRTILQRWTAAFRQPVPVIENQFVDEEETDTDELEKRDRREQRQRINRPQVLANVESRKRIIVEYLQRRDFARAHRLIDELVDYQMANGGPRFTVMSLCDLAMEAKLLDNHRLQLELTERSIRLKDDDGWSWAQYADALLRMRRPNEALRAYEQAVLFGAGVIAQSGHAETLRAMDRLPEALAAYDTVIAEHPEDVVAKSGRAETLRAMNRLPEALAAYEEIRSRFPNDMFARNGRSLILAALHRYDEALTDLPISDMVSRGDWIGFHIRGMILLKMGRIDEALNIFEQGVIGNPWTADREVFCATLGIAWMRQHNHLKAAEVLNEVKSPILQPRVDILRVHSYGENQKYDIAQEVYERVAANPLPESSALTEELNRRYVQRTGAQQDDEWVFDQETNLFLATNQNLTSSLYAY